MKYCKQDNDLSDVLTFYQELLTQSLKHCLFNTIYENYDLCMCNY